MFNPDGIWRQHDEITFIKGLGTHYQPGLHRTRVAYSKADALRGYLVGLERRTAWAGLNREELQQVAEEELQRCEAPAEEPQS